MKNYSLQLSGPKPYFAELPYALWGEINYDSDGDCKRPTDQQWTWLELQNRVTDQTLSIQSNKQGLIIKSDDDALAAQAATFIIERCGATSDGEDPRSHIGEWSYADAYARTVRIRAEFPRRELAPFDSHLFWGSWKWVGWFATDFTWVGRWIMNSVLTHDTRAVVLCIDWLQSETVHRDQSAALRHALTTLTDQRFETDQEWIRWYEDSGNRLYPEPDFNEWLEDFKRG